MRESSHCGGPLLFLGVHPSILISPRPRTPHAMAMPQYPCSCFPEDWAPDSCTPQPACTLCPSDAPRASSKAHLTLLCICGNHPHQPGQCETTCPSFAPYLFQKGNFCKPKSDLRSLSPASQSFFVILGHCHLVGEANTDRIPAPVPSVCLLGQF